MNEGLSLIAVYEKEDNEDGSENSSMKDGQVATKGMEAKNVEVAPLK